MNIRKDCRSCQYYTPKIVFAPNEITYHNCQRLSPFLVVNRTEPNKICNMWKEDKEKIKFLIKKEEQKQKEEERKQTGTAYMEQVHDRIATDDLIIDTKK